MQTVILASASPRRAQLLASAGLHFAVHVSGISEEVEESQPQALVQSLALSKASAVAGQCGQGIIVGADTTVCIDGTILNKPVDARDATRMLDLLRGRTHEVWTGIAVVDASGGRAETAAICSRVTMKSYSDREIEAYVATGEPLDKAGAYAIQGGAGVFVAAIDGCYANVVGLPLCELRRMLLPCGIQIAATACARPDGTLCSRIDVTTS